MSILGAILIAVILGAVGFLEWAIGTIMLIFLDGLVCSFIESQTYVRPEVMSIQEAMSDTHNVYSGIITDYISIDISIVWFVGLIVYKIYQKVK